MNDLTPEGLCFVVLIALGLASVVGLIAIWIL